MQEKLTNHFVNEIIIDSKGNKTICGALAHKLWVAKAFPSLKCSANNFYVLELVEMPQGFRWDIKAAQTTRAGAEAYMDCERVLVDVSNAPTK